LQRDSSIVVTVKMPKNPGWTSTANVCCYARNPVFAINPSVCLSVREHISLWNRSSDRHKSLYGDSCLCGSVLLRQRCATLCTSGFWMTSRLAVMGATPEGGCCTQRRRSMTGRSLMSMNACLLL